MTTANPRQTELQENYKAFEKLLPNFRLQDNGKFALMRHGELINIFDSPKDAIIFAEAQFKDGLYSVQQITTKTVDLGYFSHAVSSSVV